MARYDYECQDCGHTFEVRERISDHAETNSHECPECGSGKTRQVLRSFYPDTSSKS